MQNAELVEYCVERAKVTQATRCGLARALRRVYAESNLDEYIAFCVRLLFHAPAPTEREDPEHWVDQAVKCAYVEGAEDGIHYGKRRGKEMIWEARRFGRTSTERDAPWLYDEGPDDES